MGKIYKIIIMGDMFVGKSSIFNILSEQYQTEYKSTIGIDFIKKKKFNNTKNTLMVWDTSGQEKFHTLLRSYYRGIHGAILVFDTSNSKTFSNIDYWLKELYEYSHSMISVILIGNKTDLQRTVSENEAYKLAQLHNISYLETSVKLNYNVIDIFTILCQDIKYEKWLKYTIKDIEKQIENKDVGCFCIK